MAKAKSRPAATEERPPTRRSDGDDSARRLLVGGFAGLLLLVAGIIAFGWWWTQVRPLDKVVLRVENTEYSLRHVQRRINLLIDTTPSLLEIFLPGQIVDFTLNQLEDEAKVLEGANELDISVTDEEMDQEIRIRANLALGVDANLFASELRRLVDESGLKQDEFLQMVRADLLRTKVDASFAENAPESGPQVRAQWLTISLEESDLADTVLGRVQDGEEFLAIGEELLTVSSSEIDWNPRISAQFPEGELEEFLFSAEQEEISEIIQGEFSLYIVQLLEREEDRDLDDGQRNSFGAEEARDWLLELDGRLAIERDINDEDRVRALADIL